MYTIPEVNFEEITGRDGNLGLITLRRTHALNALNHVMINVLAKQLAEWESAKHIKAVVIRAAPGRAFSAGGDLRLVYENRFENNTQLPIFFRDEYDLNHQIHHYTKPYIALLDGIVMGGGIGLSIHASHRVATSQLDFSMPETGIGFFPDVGTTWYLSRLPHYLGFYLALSGKRIQLADCMALGLVDYSVAQNVFPEMIYALADTSLMNGQAVDGVTEVLNTFVQPVVESELWSERTELESCFKHKTIENILQALKKTPRRELNDIAELLMMRSPMSLKVTLLALQNAAKLDFDQCIEMEYTLCRHFLMGHDFFEGIRAVVIDKDRKPHWKPHHLDKISNREVKRYFELIEEI